MTSATRIGTTSGAASHHAHAVSAQAMVGNATDQAADRLRARRGGVDRRTTVADMSSNLPFGFGAGEPGNPANPGEGSDDLAGKIPLFAELQKLMSWTGGPVNWDLARRIAISTVAADHREPTAGEPRSRKPSGWPTCGLMTPPTCPRAS